MKTILIKNALLVNEGQTTSGDLLIKNGRIDHIDSTIDIKSNVEINAEGKYLIPGIIDDQVHFREPGLTHKADLYSEPRSAVAGGITSFMEMPNTKPPAFTQDLLQDKYDIASKKSLANYSFFMGVSNDNLEEVLKTDPKSVCGIKIFMGSSTGNLLVDDPNTLEKVFAKTPMLIATHCEDEKTIRRNEDIFKQKYGEVVPFSCHPEIRSAEGCLISSTLAVNLAKKTGARLHILHISTADELKLFSNSIPLKDKLITAEVCVHHLYFSSLDYGNLGSLIKCNPAIKEPGHKEKLWEALLDNRLDIVATDHAPHTLEEKNKTYFKAPSGLPLAQHSLNIMMDFSNRGKINIEKIVEKMCHHPAICFKLKDRGFLREGYWADLVLVDPQPKWTVAKENIFYKCGWSPLEGKEFKGKVTHTFVNGHLVWESGKFDESQRGMRLEFNR